MTQAKLTLTALVLTMAPGLAMAEGCNWMKQQTAMSCAEGSVLDPATGTCVPQVTS